MDHHVSACSAYKQNMKAIDYFLDDVDATDKDHEEYVRELIMKYEPRCFFCNLEGHFKSDCTQFWDPVADAKHPRHEEALSGVKASRARLTNKAESPRKETTPRVESGGRVGRSTQSKLWSGGNDRVTECQTGANHERSGAMGKVGSGKHRSSGKI